MRGMREMRGGAPVEPGAGARLASHLELVAEAGADELRGEELRQLELRGGKDAQG